MKVTTPATFRARVSDVAAVIVRIAGQIASWLPPAAPLLVCANWIVARVELGRVPVPMRDDPKHVGHVTPVVHWVAAWAIAIGFWVFLASMSVVLVASFVPGPSRIYTMRRLRLAGLGAALVYGWAVLDPGRLVEWFLD